MCELAYPHDVCCASFVRASTSPRTAAKDREVANLTQLDGDVPQRKESAEEAHQSVVRHGGQLNRWSLCCQWHVAGALV